MASRLGVSGPSAVSRSAGRNLAGSLRGIGLGRSAAKAEKLFRGDASGEQAGAVSIDTVTPALLRSPAGSASSAPSGLPSLGDVISASVAAGCGIPAAGTYPWAMSMAVLPARLYTEDSAFLDIITVQRACSMSWHSARNILL